ncbi:MAG: SCO family protein [Balneolaceae bacterium]
MKIQLIILAFFFMHLAGLQLGLAQNGHENHKATAAGEISSEHSLYHLDAVWTDHRNEQFSLSEFRGQPVIITMFYGNCTQVCPILIRDANRVYSALDESQREKVKVLAITFDPENDTPERLSEYAAEKNLNTPEWHFVTGSSTSIRELAMMLGVQYTRKSDGHFAHSNLVTVLDGEGRIVQRLEGLNQPVEDAAHWIQNYLTLNFF